MDTIAARVLKLLAKQVGREPNELTEESSLEHLGIDSLGMVEIIFGLEDEFNISIPESNDIQQRLKGFATVADIIQMVEALSETAAPAK
jgi:acyl carrier protein